MIYVVFETNGNNNHNNNNEYLLQILKLLLEGAMELANIVCEHIKDLLMELKVLNRELRRNSLEEQPSTSSGGSRGTLLDRYVPELILDYCNTLLFPHAIVFFSRQLLQHLIICCRFTNESVVVTAPSKVKAGSDLQLPSMAALVSKTSSQAFFLRILKVIVQIREAVRLANNKKTCTYEKYTILIIINTLVELYNIGKSKRRTSNSLLTTFFTANQSSESSVDTGNTNQASESGNFLFCICISVDWCSQLVNNICAARFLHVVHLQVKTSFLC